MIYIVYIVCWQMVCLPVCMSVLYCCICMLYIVHWQLFVEEGLTVCLSTCPYVCLVFLYFEACTLYILCVLAAALGRLYVDNWRHGGNHPPTTIGLSTSTCSLDLRHIQGFRRNTNTNTNENANTNNYEYTNITPSPATTLCCRPTKHTWLPMKHKDERHIFENRRCSSSRYSLRK